jgi:hypothetical protein
MFVSQLRKSDPLLPKNNFLSQGWLIRRLFEVWMHFTLLGPRLQVASPQLSMHGSNILIDGESACGCGLRGASMSCKPPSYSRWHIL